jgi:hypothetical protein
MVHKPQRREAWLRVKPETRTRLERLKVHRRQAYDEVLQQLLDDAERRGSRRTTAPAASGA